MVSKQDKKIYVRLNGGLGNQLFQYAIARSLSLEWGGCVYLDTQGLKGKSFLSTHRIYELEYFCIDALISNGFVCIRHSLAKFFPVLLKLLFGIKTIREHTLSFDSSVQSNKPNIYLLGYWQSYKYFSKNAKAIRSDIVLNKPLSIDATKYLNSISAKACSVAVHVRRGDYVSNKAAAKFHGVLPFEYYKNAMQMLKNAHINAHFYVFSDDIEWCLRKFSGYPDITFVTNESSRSSCEDLFLISKCTHHIIANSSFSWWGAWLADENVNNQHIVVAPQKWFLNLNVNLEDRFPPHWRVI